MEAADPGGTARREPLVGRRLAELSERQGWVHHVVDADTGGGADDPPGPAPGAALAR
jgi:hypothetical protein